MRVRLAIGALVLFAAAPAFAGDPTVAVQPGEQVAQAPAQPGAPPPVLVSRYDWSGFYVGAHVGGAWDSDSFAFSPAKTHTTNKASSAFGGGQVGYNFQISSFVWGVEGDASGAGLSGSSPCPNPFFTCGHKIDFLASLRARAGFTLTDRILLYGTGGAAFADVKHTALPPGVAPFVFSGNYSSTQVGWAAGGGLEYALTNNWSAKVEYLHYGLGSSTAPMGTLSATNLTRVSDDVDTVEVGVNYHFNVPPPPAPEMPAALPAPLPSTHRVFLVFFDWDRDNITPAGMQVVEKAADAYRSGASVRLMVTGYTDRSGSPGYNQRLSERRANNVAKALQGMGVPHDQMAVSGRGENDNRVPTAPGVREPQNRRVEINFP
jgi:outer membrane immunogenic protein